MEKDVKPNDVIYVGAIVDNKEGVKAVSAAKDSYRYNLYLRSGVWFNDEATCKEYIKECQKYAKALRIANK